jgi:phosphate acetyltransferase
MDILERIRDKAKRLKRHICLPETYDDRVIECAAYLLKEKICAVTLIGESAKVASDAKRLGLDLSAASVVDHLKEPARKEYVAAYYELRKAKGMTPEEADKVMSQHIYYGAMCVSKGRCDGMTAGSTATTPDLMRAMLQVIRPRKNIKTVSSYFMMVTRVPEVGVNGTLIFSDAGLVPDPTPEQLVDIAASSADSCRKLLDAEPVVGFLSFSTKGSASHPLLDKVIAASKMFREKYPHIKSDGELQLDSAILPSVAARKCGTSGAAGKCNVLIFPDLNAGNIGYKLTERLGGATAIGPLVQGLAKPGNDLSRGCSVMDIVNAAAVACVQSVD